MRPVLVACLVIAAGLAPCVMGMPAPDFLGPETQAWRGEFDGTRGAPTVCSAGALSDPLPLHEVIERTLCHDPSIRQAWAQAGWRTAQLGQSQTSYFPRLDAQLGQLNDRSAVRSDSGGEPVREAGSTRSAGFALSWVLLDFGRRAASVESARQLLAAAHADQNTALQAAFLQAAQLYFAAQASTSRLLAAEQVLALAKTNYLAASEKHSAGAAALSDRLQAQTAFTQAGLRLSREHSALMRIQGEMALRMGLAPSPLIRVAMEESVDEGVQDYIEQVDTLLAIARQEHPVLIAAKARVRAAEADLDEAQAMGRPTLSLTGGYTQVRRSAGTGTGYRRQEGSFGLQLSIPIFRGFEKTYQIGEAREKIAMSRAEFEASQQRIAVDVWTQYERLRMETESLRYTNDLVKQSTQTLEIVRGRYQAGVGSMTEVLNVMNAYAEAQNLHIDAVTSWQLSRLNLAGSLGRLGFWSLER